MASRKPSSKVDRLPVDYGQPKKQQQNLNDSDFGAALTLTPLDDEARAARDARALEVLRSYAAEDLAEVLGLAGVPERAEGPLTVPCPQCARTAGNRCVGGDGLPIARSHRGRHRLAGKERS